MGTKCRSWEIEIAAAGRGALSPAAATHVEECSACGRLYADVRALADATAGHQPMPSRTAKEVADEAVRTARRARSPLWALPCLSASASAAGLILYFGVFHTHTGGAAEPRNGGASAEAAIFFTFDAEDADAPELPDSLKAVREMLLAGSGEESHQ